MSKCYVYLIEVDGVARYIGKGTGQRLHQHLKIAGRINHIRANGKKAKATHFHNCLAKALRNGLKIEARILVDGLTDEEAWELEKFEIAAYSTDQLWNWTPGGEGRTAEDLKRQWTTDPDLRARHAAAMERVFADPLVIERLRKSAAVKWASPEFRSATVAAIAAAVKTPENRARAAEHALSIWSDPFIRAKLMDGLARDKERPGYVEDKRKAGRAASREDKVRAGQSVPKEARIAGLKRGWANPELRDKRVKSLTEKAIAREAERRANGYYDDPTVIAQFSEGGKAAALARTPETTAKRSASNAAAWAERTAEIDNAVLEFIRSLPDGADPKQLWAKFGKRQGLVSKLLKRGLIERRGGYHTGRYYTSPA